MAQIAQQDNIVVDIGTISSWEDVSEDAKRQLRRAYIRGTIHDVIVKAKDEGDNETTSKVIATYKYVVDNALVVTFQDSFFDDQPYRFSCGAFQPEDYSDDVPYEGE